ncbi:fibrinogen-like YCDxxxxGGGW domain-containing protein [Flavivirga eckloniae]|uniref:Fibrinogen C-terminal domain-containing protein n=1 Tax=Flavivirga eckloniae TaxID=1803846 RepID=A0A2K9PM29_9FLAO|nr:fibrinogen-like YCDxxxxGGGW domain-containing protein [Flavivirga eckloniae]AUP78129.1 hypothetical protein C1H87_05110 [Flavivirga eckloniae]
MTKLTYIAIILCWCVHYSFAQVGIGTTAPSTSAILDVTSSTQGLLTPRMTEAQRDAIVSPAEGLFIYNLDAKCFQYYKGSAWSGCLGETQNKLDCNSVSANGNYIHRKPLNNSHTITLDVLVNEIGPYNISTNSANGYSFSASGTFASLGVNTITLIGSGTSRSLRTNTFTITFAETGQTCNIDIQTTFRPSCKAYFDDGFVANGSYMLDSDGSGGNPAFECWCDQTVAGGGWTLVFSHFSPDGYWANATEANEHNVDKWSSSKYSILSKIDELKSQGYYEFLLYYPRLNKRNHWRQTADPRSRGGYPAGSGVPGYQGISLEMTDSSFGGLELSGPHAYLDGSIDGAGSFHYAVGSFGPDPGASDPAVGLAVGVNEFTYYVQLYTR